MELRDTRFSRFVVDFWIDYQRFRGASKVCAILLNLLLLIFKLVLCGVVLLVLAPYLAVGALRNRCRRSLIGQVLCALLMIVCIAIDIPVVILCLSIVILTFEFLVQGQLLASLIFGLLSWILIRLSWTLITATFCRTTTIQEQDDDIDDEEEDEEEEEVTWYEVEDDMDEIVFCQLFTLGEDMCLLIDHIEMCPDETAFIRVVSEETYTSLYRRKVRRDKAGNRFIVFNSTNYYLDDKKTQPVITKK